MIETGKILQQRYRIDKQIGQGGMGAVFVATDERFGSVVAIKQTLLMDDSYRKAIEREARLLNSLKHTALPRVTDHFLEDNGQYLVMEFIAGEDLGHALERDEKAFPVDQVLNWADQLLDALDFLHSQAIPVIHRDIKPQNLKVTPKGQIVLLDFGLAKGNPTDAGHQTAAKSIFGYSRSYASLEQIQGTGTDPRSDLYSLAATLYHLLTGTPPEDALTRAMAVLSGNIDPLVPANRLNPEVPAGVAGVLHRAMDLNAASRPASAAEMRDMLREPGKYALTTNTAATTAKTSSDLSSEPTKILLGDTFPDSGKNTDVKTAVHPGYISEETKLKSTVAHFGDTNGKTRPKKRGVIAALASILLLAGGAFCVYVLDPGLFHRSSVQTDGSINSSAGNTAEPDPSPASAAANAQAGTESEGGQSGQPKAANPGDKGPETAKDTKPKTKSQVDGSNDNADGDSPDIYVGNVKIRNGRVETPDVIVDENGIVRRVPRVPSGPRPGVNPGVLPPLTPEQLQQLTPEQRRRLRQIYLRQNRQTHPIP